MDQIVTCCMSCLSAVDAWRLETGTGVNNARGKGMAEAAASPRPCAERQHMYPSTLYRQLSSLVLCEVVVPPRASQSILKYRLCELFIIHHFVRYSIATPPPLDALSIAAGPDRGVTCLVSYSRDAATAAPIGCSATVSINVRSATNPSPHLPRLAADPLLGVPD